MAEISSKKIKLNVDDKIIEIKNESKQNFNINKALIDPQQFKEFVENPKEFVKKFDLSIDQTISDQLHDKLKGLNSLKDLKEITGEINKIDSPGETGGGATLWAVASAAYSIAKSKVAVAY